MRPAGSAVGAFRLSYLKIVRSTPVLTCTVADALLLVSSASKIELAGSTITLLVSGPVPDGGTTMIENVLVESAGMLGVVHVSALVGASRLQVKALPGTVES